jgi:hypothetical protein
MIAGLLNQTITIYSRTSYNAQGREVLSSGTTAVARVEAKSKNRMSPTGAIVTIAATAYVLPTVTIEIDDKIAVGTANYKVFAKYPVPDGQGNINHIKLELLKWQI